MATWAPTFRSRSAAVALALAFTGLTAGACASDVEVAENSPSYISNVSGTASDAQTDTATDTSTATDTATPTFMTTASPSSAPDPLQVGVVVTYWGWNPAENRIEVAAFSQSFEPAGGTCTLTLTLNDVQRSAQRAAVAGASTTDCGTITIDGEKLPRGTWTGVVTFDAAESAGISTPFAIEVPA